MSTATSGSTEIEQVDLTRAKAMAMVAFPLRRLASVSHSNSDPSENSQTLLDLSPEIFRLDELDAGVVENIYGQRANRLKRVDGVSKIHSDEGPKKIEAKLDCFILRGRSHAGGSSETAGKYVTDFLIAFVTFDQDNQAVGEIAELLHRPSRCTSRTSCSQNGHFGLCVKIRSEISAAITRVAAGPAANRLSFILRGDGNFALKLQDGSDPEAHPPLTYLPQRGRSHAFVISRSIDPQILAQSAGEAQSFRWRAGSKAWVVANAASPGVPSRVLSSPSQRADNKRQLTFFNDLTLPVLMVIQQAFAIEELRTEFSVLCAQSSDHVLRQAKQSRVFARHLLAFRNSTWVTTLSFSPALTDYLNEFQQSLRLRQSYDALMDDFTQWTSHLELVAQAEQSATAERTAVFLTVLSIWIAVGALCFQQGTAQAVACSIVAILSASGFLLWQTVRRMRK